jgi:hypothetical protein
MYIVYFQRQNFTIVQLNIGAVVLLKLIKS